MQVEIHNRYTKDISIRSLQYLSFSIHGLDQATTNQIWLFSKDVPDIFSKYEKSVVSSSVRINSPPYEKTPLLGNSNIIWVSLPRILKDENSSEAKKLTKILYGGTAQSAVGTKYLEFLEKRSEGLKKDREGLMTMTNWMLKEKLGEERGIIKGKIVMAFQYVKDITKVATDTGYSEETVRNILIEEGLL